MRSGQALHSHFHYSFLICCLHLFSSCLLKRAQQHLSSLQDECYMCWLLIWRCMQCPLPPAALFHCQRCESRDEGRLYFHGWLSLSDILPPLWLRPTVTLPADTTDLRDALIKNNFQMDSDSAPVGDSVPYRRQQSALEPQKTYFPLSKRSVKENA